MTDFDDTLTRLFAEGRVTLPAEEFLENVASRMHRARRQRTIRRTALVVAAAMLVVVLTPFVAKGSLAVANLLTASLLSLGSALASPLAWICSLTITTWAVRRTRRA